MKLSNSFFYSSKDAPRDATVLSHQLMLRSNMIAQTASGIYCWLPLGLRVLNKVCDVVRDEHEKAGIIELLMSTIQLSDLWIESGRYDAYGEELLRFKDRKEHEMLYGPTNEEQVTDIFRRFVKSYKDLPKILYHIQWKFRDEIRPRFGVMRGREFLMKDAYSFDMTKEDAVSSYDKMFNLYIRIFKRLNLKPLAVRADSGAIGGDMSHEFHILADSGESKLYYDKRVLSCDACDVRDCYAVSEEKYNKDECPVAEEDLEESRGIEVGHIFYFGDKYTKSMNVTVSDRGGKNITPVMGSYGIGISRLVAAVIEASHDANGIIWPEEIAPFMVSVINLTPADTNCRDFSEKLYSELKSKGADVLYDDRDLTAGVKLKDADLVGIPHQILISKNNLPNGNIEIKDRASGKIELVSVDDLTNIMGKFC